MSIQFRKNLAVVTVDDLPQLAAWLAQHSGQVFRLKAVRGDAYFQALGPEDEACRVPINITSKAPGNLKLISNFAATPFALDGLDYGSIEAFWQGLKFPDEANRRELAPLHGARAKDAADASDEDSRTIPGAILAEIWMRCRTSLRRSSL
jgi:hypothetical protein